MSGAHEEQLRTLERAIAELPRPTARPEFRAELREQFLRGAAAPIFSFDDGVQRTRAARRPWPRALAIAAAAAVLVIVPFLRTGSSHPAWRAVEYDATDSITIDEQTVPLGDDGRLNRALDEGGCELRTLDDAAYLIRDENLLLRYEAESRIALLPPLVEEEREVVRLELFEGATFASMAPSFRGLLRFETRHGSIDLVGEAISVELIEGGVCICCRSGQATIRRPDKEPLTVDSGKTLFVPGDGSPPRDFDRVVHHEVVNAAHGVAREHLLRSQD